MHALGRTRGALIIILLLALALAGSTTSAAADKIRVAIISDINGRYGSTLYNQRVPVAIERIIALRPDLVISTGDMVAGQRPDPPLSQARLDAMWDNFDAGVRAPLKRAGIPLLMTPGNHDASAYPGFERERATYSARQAAHPPGLAPLPNGNYPYHYAASYSGVLFVSLDATTSGKLPASQRAWLARQLDIADDHRSVVVFGHLPLQPVAIGRERDVITDESLEALLRGVKNVIYLSGHHHAYYPGWRDGLDMLSVGNLGGNPRRLVGTASTTGFSFALLEIDHQGAIEISAYRGPSFQETISIESLPKNLLSSRGKVLRRDLASTAVKNDRKPVNCDFSSLAEAGSELSRRCDLSWPLGNLEFELETSGEGSITRLLIAPKGLKEANEIVEIELDGTAHSSVIADLNADGWPEIYVFVSSAGSGSYGSLVAYAVNNGKSMSPIYLPPLGQTPRATEGYMGHDQFSVVENRLVRRFPVYTEGDTNASPSGGTRQLQYRLGTEEAGWALQVDKVTEY